MRSLAICRQSTPKGTARGIEADVLRSSVAQRRRQQKARTFCQLESEIWEIEDLAALQCFKGPNLNRLRERSFPTGYLDNFQRCRQGGSPRNSVTWILVTWILMRMGSERQERADTNGIFNMSKRPCRQLCRLDPFPVVTPSSRGEPRGGRIALDQGLREQNSSGRDAVVRSGKSGRKHVVL